MTQEDKELLLKDLCTRLSTWKWNDCVRFKEGGVLFGIKGTIILIQSGANGDMISECDVEEIHPYLRPMSSMTEEEAKEYNDLCFCNTPYPGIAEDAVAKFMDWLNAHHFDYRGLIPMDLAFEAPDGIYNIKEK